MIRARDIGVLSVLVVLVSAAAIAAAKWRVDRKARTQRTAIEIQDAYVRMTAPAPGRAEYVPGAVLLAAPEAYNGRRVVLRGIWKVGFEVSSLTLTDDQKMEIWVDIDPAVREPMGNMSDRDDTDSDVDDFPKYSVTAEGTYRYRGQTEREPVPGGFGHLGGFPGYFRIDRIFQCRKISEDVAP